MLLKTRIQKTETQLNGIITGIQNGDFNALESFIALKQMAEQIKSTMDAIKDDAQTELSRHGKGEHILHGVVCSVANVGGRWDFKSIPEWNTAKQQLTDIENRSKSAYKAHEQNIMSVGANDGEIIPLPKYSGSSETIKIKIPKKY